MIEVQTLMNARVTSESSFLFQLLHTTYKEENRTETRTVTITIFYKYCYLIPCKDAISSTTDILFLTKNVTDRKCFG